MKKADPNASMTPSQRIANHITELADWRGKRLAQLRKLPRGLVLHGHLHRRMERVLTTDAGQVQQLGATSASLHREERDRMAARAKRQRHGERGMDVAGPPQAVHQHAHGVDRCVV